MTQPAYPGAPTDGGDHTITGIRQWLTQIARVINRMLTGKFNNTGEVTLTANAASTTVTDSRATAFSCIGFMPTTSNAATAKQTMYVSTRSNGSFVITHANNAQTDKSFVYSLQG